MPSLSETLHLKIKISNFKNKDRNSQAKTHHYLLTSLKYEATPAFYLIPATHSEIFQKNDKHNSAKRHLPCSCFNKTE